MGKFATLRFVAASLKSPLIGIPYRVTVGRALAQGEVEVKVRRTGEILRLGVAEVVPVLSIDNGQHPSYSPRKLPLSLPQA